MIRLVITDDESLIAASLATLLALEEDLEVVAVCASGEELIEWWQRELARGGGRAPAEVLVCDLQLTGVDGVEAAGAVRRLSPSVRALVVTSHARPAALRRALEEGLEGFLPKTSSAAAFAEAIRTVHRGGRYVDPELAAAALSAGDSP